MDFDYSWQKMVHRQQKLHSPGDHFQQELHLLIRNWLQHCPTSVMQYINEHQNMMMEMGTKKVIKNQEGQKLTG